MTTDEKRRCLDDFCEGRRDCGGCPLLPHKVGLAACEFFALSPELTDWAYARAFPEEEKEEEKIEEGQPLEECVETSGQYVSIVASDNCTVNIYINPKEDK